MILRPSLLTVALVGMSPAPSLAQAQSMPRDGFYQLAQLYACGLTCGQVSSCREAVYQWCVCGYSRADGDRDGVPCETVCGQSSASSLARVRELKEEFGCR